MSDFTQPRYPTVRDCLVVVSKEFGITVLDLCSDRRMRPLARPRQVAYWLARMSTPRSLPEIGRQIGDRDCTTVMTGIRVVEVRRQNEPDFRQLTDRLLCALQSPAA